MVEVPLVVYGREDSVRHVIGTAEVNDKGEIKATITDLNYSDFLGDDEYASYNYGVSVLQKTTFEPLEACLWPKAAPPARIKLPDADVPPVS